MGLETVTRTDATDVQAALRRMPEKAKKFHFSVRDGSAEEF